MRQGDGSDLPGVSGSRTADIGIIYVAPNDERQSVLAAILTQDKLGRKQVVVVLPDQNKAFQRAVDFDGLKGLRRGLKTQLVFVAPGGPGPAEFARQRGFPVYSSLENYAESLRDADQAKAVAKKGWLFLPRQKPANSTAAASTDPVKLRQGQPLPDTAAASPEQASARTDSQHDTSAVAGGMAGAAAVSIDALATHRSSPSASPGYEDDWDTLPAADLADSSLSDDVPTQANTGSHSASAASAEGNIDPKIIQLSSSRGRTTDKLPIPVIASIPAAQPDVPSVNSPTRQRNTGKIAAVGGASMAAGAATTGRAAGVGRIPPTRGSIGGGGGGPGGPRRTTGRLWGIGLALLALTLLIGSAIALAIPGIRDRIPNVVPGIVPSATVTITPASADVKNTYGGIFGVTGTPDPNQRQIQARQLSSTTPSQSKTVNATGVRQTSGVQATGTITFYNGAFKDQQVNAGTTFFLSSGLQIVTDRNVDVPPQGPPPNGQPGVATVSAHAASVGPGGNIAALTINGTCCSSDNSIFAKNLTAFSGGQDPQNFTVVQQSDIDAAARPLEGTLIPNAQKSLQAQVHPNERFVSSPQCVPNVTSDHAVGDQATSVTVTVKVTCSGEVYDAQGAQALAANLLKKQAAKDPGPGYALVGDLVTTITQVTVQDPKKGTLLLMVKAEGIWVFQFSDAQRQALAKLIAGKSKRDAQALLLQQTGVAKVDIKISGGDGNTLPTDPNAITIVVLSVPGLQATPTPTTGPGSPTVPGVTPTVGKG